MHDSPPPRPHLVLMALAVGVCALGMDMFVLIGVLDPLAADLAMTPRQAGWIISAYAICYALCAPINVMLFGRIDRRLALVLGPVLFTAGNVICVCGSGIIAIVVGRLICAFGGALFMPTAIATAQDIVPAERKGIALSSIYGGMTLAQAAGIPAVTWLAQTAGWRAALYGVIASGLIAILALSALASQLRPSTNSNTSNSVRRGAFGLPVAGLLATTFLIVVSDYAVYSYVSIIFEQTRHSGVPILPLVLFAFGIGGVIGNIATGILTDRIGPTRVLLGTVATQTLLLIAVVLGRANGAAAVALSLLWGATTYMYLVPIQHRLLSRADTAQRLVLALNGSLVNFGIAAGAAIGGMALERGGPSALIVPAGAIGVAAILTGGIFVPRRKGDPH